MTAGFMRAYPVLRARPNGAAPCPPRARGARCARFPARSPSLQPHPTFAARFDPQTRPGRALALLIVVATALRVAFALGLGLGIDEAYTVATARVFQWSYFDHPGIAWWLASLAAHVFHSEAPLAVRAPFIALAALSTWLMYVLAARAFGKPAGFYAALLFSLAPALGVTDGSFVLPDGPLVAALLAGAICLLRATAVGEPRAGLWWLAAGACAGLALMSKYHGVFLLAGAGLFLLTSRAQWRWLASPWPYAGALVAAAMCAPIIVWNAEHGWASFAFQGGRASALRLRPWLPLLVIAGQALFLTPWIFAPLVARAWAAVRRGPKHDPAWLLLCLAAGPILLFTLLPAFTGNRGHFHWAMPGYLMLFPLLGEAVARRLAAGAAGVRRWLMFTSAATPVLIALVIVIAVLPWPGLPFAKPGQKTDPLIETLAWTNLREAFAQAGLLGRPGLFVAAGRWHEAGRIDYALGGALPVACVCGDPRGYGQKAPLRPFAGEDALIVVPAARRGEVEKEFGPFFSDIAPWREVSIDHGGRRVYDLAVFTAHAFTLPQP
jgi:4-amino-4-deoxy-L-arabinose transferase-like glycosyltransferase